MAHSYLPADERPHSDRQDKGYLSTFYQVREESIFIGILVLVVALWLGVGRDVNLTWLQLALVRSSQSVMQSIAGLIVSYSAIILVFLILSSIFHFRYSKPLIYSASVLGGLLFISFVNIWPITVYLEILREKNINPLFVKILCLSFANGMFFFLFYDVLTKTLLESKKAYVISSKYRGRLEIGTLLEIFVSSILNLSSSIFYYIFSFTVLTDLFFYDSSEVGILVVIFHEVLNEGWTEKAFFDLTVMLACALAIRTFLQILSDSWELRRDLVARAHR